MLFTKENIFEMVEKAKEECLFNENSSILDAFDDGVKTGLNNLMSKLYEADTRELEARLNERLASTSGV